MTDRERRAGLDRSLVSGIAWTAVFRWAFQPISWVATFYAARVLDPSDFGLYSMALLGIGLVRLVEGFGLDAILVQDRTIVHKAQERLAGLVLLLGLFLYSVFFVTAPIIAGFFEEPQVTSLVRVLALLTIFDAIQVVARAELQRRLEFRRLAIVTFVQSFTTAAVLSLAVTIGLGFWSLVVNDLGGALAATLLLLYWAPYRVAYPREMARLARPLLQGWRVLVSRIAWYGTTSADQVIIGRVLGKDLLGPYNFALRFSTIGQEEIGSVISKVVPGIFSEVQDRIEELRRYFLMLTEFVTILSFPIFIGMALVADLLIPLALGDEWASVVTPLCLLCIHSAFLSSQMLNSHVMLWTGRFRAQMWCSVLSVVVMPLTLLFAVRYGLPGVGLAWAFIYPLVTLPAFWVSFTTIKIRTRDWLDALQPAIGSCLLMSGAVLGMRALLPASTPLLLVTALSVVTGMVVYPATIWFLFNRRARTLIELARTIRQGRVVGV